MGLTVIHEYSPRASWFYELFARWCELSDREIPAKKTFTELLAAYGITKVTIKGYPYYKGITLLARMDEIESKLLGGKEEGLEAHHK
ncbi:MAG: hypothetical protein ACP5N5_05085 [Desulfurococcus sp.]|uniref:hypothetical protein n=1 Tax=Desulfurococcus sp. TaxID=51678 RepID=UPI003D12AC3E